jgi:acetyl-CoA carboxylase biotin carboxyl carrier protein
MAVSKEDIKNLIKIFEQSDWQEMRLEVDGLKLMVSKSGEVARAASAPMAATATTSQAIPTPSATMALAPAPLALAANQTVIKAPNLGTFWRQPKPGAPAYVEIGQTIDVMKLFTPVKAGVRGKIVRCLAEDGQMVEYDMPLFVVEKI